MDLALWSLIGLGAAAFISSVLWTISYWLNAQIKNKKDHYLWHEVTPAKPPEPRRTVETSSTWGKRVQKDNADGGITDRWVKMKNDGAVEEILRLDGEGQYFLFGRLATKDECIKGLAGYIIAEHS